MKKLSKLASLAAATAFLLAGMTACFTSVNDDGAGEPKSVDYNLAEMGLPDGVYATEITSADKSIVDVETKTQESRAATADAGKAIKSVTVTAYKAGSTYFIIKTAGDDEGTWYLPVTVTSDLEVKINKDDLTDEEPAGTAKNATPFAIDFSKFTAAQYKVAAPSDKGTVGLKSDIDLDASGITVTASTSLNVRFSDGNGTVDSLNFSGDIGDMSGATLSKTPGRYISIPVDGAGTMTVEYKTTHKGKDLTGGTAGNKTQIAVVTKDGDAYKVLKCQTAETTDEAGKKDTLSLTIAEAATVYVVFSQNGTTKSKDGTATGGIDVYTIEVK